MSTRMSIAEFQSMYPDRCFFCSGTWGNCKCTFPASEEGADGFDWRGMWITDPSVSSCSRFYVNPILYYGKAYIDWALKRSEENMAGWVCLDTYESSSSDSIYQVRRGGDGVLYCTCRGWVMSKNNRKRAEGEPAHCKHTSDYVSKHPGTPYHLSIGKGMSWTPSPVWNAPAKAGKTRPSVTPAAPMTTSPAGPDWRKFLLAEKEQATQRGMVTPPDALSAWAKELDLD